MKYYTVRFSNGLTYAENGEIIWMSLADAQRLASAIGGSVHRDSGVRW